MRPRPVAASAGLLLTLACDSAPSDAQVAEAVLTAPDAGEVRTFRDEGSGFRAAGVAPIRALTSLDAYEEDGSVFVAGLSHRLVPSLFAEYLPQLFVAVLESADPSLRSWSAHSWRVDAPGAAMIDPALVLGPNGRELWFVQVDGPGDPAQGGKAARVMRTRWTGSRFAGAEVVFEGRGVVDPSAVYDGDAWRLFLTRNHREIVEVTGTRKEPRIVASGLSVPHISRVDGGLRLTGQDTSRGPSTPVELRPVGEGWSTPQALLPPGDSEPCSSPSTTVHAGARWLFCAKERPGP